MTSDDNKKLTSKFQHPDEICKWCHLDFKHIVREHFNHSEKELKKMNKEGKKCLLVEPIKEPQKTVTTFCFKCDSNKVIMNINSYGVQIICSKCQDELLHMSVGKGHTEKLLRLAGIDEIYDGACTHAFCKFREAIIEK
jgi:hypothetical protein